MNALIKHKNNLIEFLIVIILATFFSSLTLWLLDTYIKYPLFILEICSIVVLYIVLRNYNFKLSLPFSFSLYGNLSFIPDILLIVLPLVLIIFGFSNLNGNLIQLSISLVVVAFLPGYAILSIFNLKKYFSKIELFVLSNVLSFLVSGFIFLILVLFDQTVRLSIICLIFISMGIFSFIKNRSRKEKIEISSFSQKYDILIILLCVTFYLLIVFIYPGLSSVYGLDIFDHYLNSNILMRTPSFYSNTNYLLFHSFEASLLTLSGGNLSIVYFQTFFASQILMFPLVIYITAKKYSAQIDARLPALATFFWVFFQGGFGWIYFAFQKLGSNSYSQLQLLNLTSDKTYFSTIYGIFGDFFVPATFSFSLILVILFLLRTKLPNRTFCVFLCLLITALFLTHVAEGFFIIFFICLIGVFSKDPLINTSLNASFFGILLTALVYVLISQVVIFFWTTTLLFSIILPLLLIISSKLLRKSIKWWELLSNVYLKLKNFNLKTGIILFLIFLYFLAVIIYINSISTFTISQVLAIFSVPWFFFPIILGVIGSLSLCSVFFVFRDLKHYSLLSIIIAFALFGLILGKAITFINMNFTTGFYESRFIVYILFSLSLLAPITIVKFMDRVSSFYTKRFRTIFLSGLLVSIIVVGGASTTLLDFDYWTIFSNDQTKKPSASEMEAITFLSSVFENDPKALLVTITSQSQKYASLAIPPGYSTSPLLYTANTPEMALNSLCFNSLYSHPYLYMHNRDFATLNSTGCDKWYMAQHLIPMLPIIFKNSEVTIYNISKIAPPLSSSDQTLLLNSKTLGSLNENELYCYDMLSLGLYNYTTSIGADNTMMEANTLLLPSDITSNTSTDMSLDGYLNFIKSGKRLVVLNTNGPGLFAEMFFNSTADKITPNCVEGSTCNFTLPEGIIVPSVDVSGENVEVLSSYISSNGSSPYILKKVIGNGQLFYINIEGLINFMKNDKDAKLYAVISMFLKGIGLHSYEFQSSLPINNGYLKEIELNGSVSISTTSVSFSSNWIVDDNENCLIFDGSSDYLSIENPSNLNNIGTMSIFAWVKTEKSNGVIFAKYLNDSKTWPGYAFGFGIWKSGNLSYWSVNGNWIQCNSKINDGTWHCVGVIISGSTLNFYDNGILVGTTISPKTILNGGDVAWIGRDFSSDSRFFEGSIKDLSIYNRTLTDTEILDLYNGGVINNTGLVLQLPMNEGSGIICYDKSGQGNDAILKNCFTTTVIPELHVENNNGVSVFYNVSNLQMNGYLKANIQAENVTISGGFSFYTEISLNKPELSFVQNTYLKGISNGLSFDVENVSKISIVANLPTKLWARSPNVQADYGLLKEVYIFKVVSSTKLSAQGISFNIVVSDEYILLSDFHIKSSNSSSITYYNELQSLENGAIPAFIAAICYTAILVPIWFIKRKRRQIRFHLNDDTT